MKSSHNFLPRHKAEFSLDKVDLTRLVSSFLYLSVLPQSECWLLLGSDSLCLPVWLINKIYFNVFYPVQVLLGNTDKSWESTSFWINISWSTCSACLNISPSTQPNKPLRRKEGQSQCPLMSLIFDNLLWCQK